MLDEKTKSGSHCGGLYIHHSVASAGNSCTTCCAYRQLASV
jgi:hypothetical protein